MSDLDSDDLANIALFLEAQLTRSGRFCPYTTATSTATLSSAHQISENSDQQQPQQRSASHGGGCGWRSPYTGKFGRGCRWRSRLRLKIAVVDGALKTGQERSSMQQADYQCNRPTPWMQESVSKHKSSTIVRHSRMNQARSEEEEKERKRDRKDRCQEADGKKGSPTKQNIWGSKRRPT